MILAGLAKDVAELLREMQHSEAQPPHKSGYTCFRQRRC